MSVKKQKNINLQFEFLEVRWWWILNDLDLRRRERVRVYGHLYSSLPFLFPRISDNPVRRLCEWLTVRQFHGADKVLSEIHRCSTGYRQVMSSIPLVQTVPNASFYRQHDIQTPDLDCYIKIRIHYQFILTVDIFYGIGEVATSVKYNINL